MELKNQYDDLVLDVTRFLSDIACNDVISFIMSLPAELVGEQYNIVLKRTVDIAASDQLMRKLSLYMHFMEIRLLKELVFHYAKELVGRVERYEADVGDYCKTTTVASFSKIMQQDREDVPEFFTTIEVKSTRDPNKVHLNDMEKLRRALGEKLGQCSRSTLAECAMIFFKVELSSASVTITWLIPSDIAPNLMAVMTEPTIGELFVSMGVIEAAIEGERYYNNLTSSIESSCEADRTPTPVRMPTPETMSRSPGCYNRLVKEFIYENSGVYNITRKVFYTCYSKIQPWLDLSLLAKYLTKYGIVKNAEDMYALTSSYVYPQDRNNSLMKLVEEAGPDGFMFLYMCLRESSVEHIGHQDAVAELDHYAMLIEQQHRTHSTASSMSRVSEQDDEPLAVSETFVLMEKFRALESSILGELKNQDFDVSNITQYIISLPFMLKNEQKPDLDRLFRYLHGNIWSFINYTLLESIIRKFGSAQLQVKMEKFVEDITLFFKHTTVSQFNVYSGRTETPTRYCELMARLNADPRQCTLEQLHLLKRGVCQRFLPPHSEFAVMFCNCACTDGGIELKWLIAIDLIVTVMTEFLRPENTSFFEENYVENFQVRRITVYPDPNPEVSAITDLKFFEGYSYVKSNGQYPSICVNNYGWVIQVYHRETVISLKLRYTIGFLSSNGVIWSANIKSYSKGFYPRIAVNDAGLVVAVYTSQIGQRMFYNLGKLSYDGDTFTIPDQDTVDSASIDWFVEEDFLGEGHNPDVSVNKDGTVIIVYDRRSIRWPWVRTYYRIGEIKGEEMKWKSSSDTDKRLIETGSSKHASVALNDKEEVVVGYSSGIERAVHFMAGTITDGSIVLGNETFSPPGANYVPVVSLNNHGHVVAVHHTLRARLSLNYNYGLMRLDADTHLGRIEWSLSRSIKFASDGYHASVAITDNRRVVTAYKSLAPRINKSLRNKIGELI